MDTSDLELIERAEHYHGGYTFAQTKALVQALASACQRHRQTIQNMLDIAREGL